MKVEIYGKPDCCLCDEAKDVIERVLSDFSCELVVRDLSQEPELLARYGEEIPVVFLDGRKAFKFHVDEAELRRRLARMGAPRRQADGAPVSGPTGMEAP